MPEGPFSQIGAHILSMSFSFWSFFYILSQISSQFYIYYINTIKFYILLRDAVAKQIGKFIAGSQILKFFLII